MTETPTIMMVAPQFVKFNYAIKAAFAMVGLSHG
jgi:hypothetical protein